MGFLLIAVDLIGRLLTFMPHSYKKYGSDVETHYCCLIGWIMILCSDIYMLNYEMCDKGFMWSLNGLFLVKDLLIIEEVHVKCNRRY